MDHTERHKALLVALVLGEVTDAETNEVGHLLETCAECRKDLAHYQETLGPEALAARDASARIGFAVQWPITLSGTQEAVNRELAALDLLLSTTFLKLETCPLAAGAAGEVREVVAVVGEPEEKNEIIRVVHEYLSARRHDQERRDATTVEAGAFLRKRPDYIIEAVTRPTRREDELDLSRLDAFLVEE
jgi:anti-sigma factor RsiW